MAALALAACAAPVKRERGVKEAATAPLHDLNLMRVEIPPVLMAARDAPYALPADADCAALDDEVLAFDIVLGPDLDAPRNGDAAEPGVLEKGVGAVGEEALDTLSSTVAAVVPFRRWVRKLSGAERRSKDVAAAIAAGSLRRAFLKGVRAAEGCDVAPVPAGSPGR